MPKPTTLEASIAALRASSKALLESLRNAPPIVAPQSCKICGKDSQSQVCSSAECQTEFYSAEYQDWPEDEEAELGTDEEEY